MIFHAGVRGRTHRYPILVDRGGLSHLGALLRDRYPGRRVAIVTDPIVGRLYGAAASRSLRSAGLRPFLLGLPGGERSKSLTVLGRVLRRLAAEGVGREDLVLALGGGVVCDLAGFAAATYGRGVAWIAVPTTLLAQADAAIGGKVGVNLPAGKNLVGAYHHPSLVLVDPETLRTLSPRTYRSGLAEVVKMGVVRLPSILTRLARLARQDALRDIGAVEPVIARCAREKARIVALDERDAGTRRILNFGHTVGHALETEGGYGRYLHGEAVAIGMAAELRLSVVEAGLDPSAAEGVLDLLAEMGLRTSLASAPGPAFWGALKQDKKRGRSGVRVVLCPAIGSAKVFALSSLTPLRRAVSWLVEPPRRRS